ncbi:MAG: serine protease AprX, partial [Bacteroidia bacterium]
MRRCLILAIMVLLGLSSFGQNPQKFWVGFMDKDNTPFTITDPIQFLSQRSIDRRTNQGISLDQKDLPVDPNYVFQVASAGAAILNKSKWFNGVSIELQDSVDIDVINALPFVQSWSPVSRLSGRNPIPNKFGQAIPNTKSSGGAPPIDHGTGYNQIDMLNGVPLHEQGFLGNGMTIAVLDAGFSNVPLLAVFDSLFNDGRILATKDFVDGDNDVYGHSTHGAYVLSTMASYWPGEFIGTAPKANYILLRSEEGGSELIIEEDNWVAAAEFADSMGADIINSSLGYTTYDDPSMDHTYFDMDGNTTRITQGADLAASRGILVVNSAGNSGQSAWNFIGAPADGDSVFAIGAVNPDGIYAEFSSKGPSADGRIKPNIVAQGAATVIADLNPDAEEPTHTGNGTSFSGPVIAGMMACFWQAFPELTNIECMNIVEQSASQYSNPDEFIGHGIPDFSLAFLITSELVPES